MSDDTKLEAQVRDQFGKGAARKIRAVGKVPAVIYGHGTEPQHITLPAHELGLILRKANAVLELDIEGKSELALVKDVQKDPVRQIIEHIDLVIIRTGERVTVDIPVHLEGEAIAGTTVNQDANTLSIEADAIHIPERIVIDIEGKEEGFQLLAKDVELPTGSVLISDPEALVVGITSATEADLGSSEGDEGAVAVEAEIAAAESE